MAGARGENPATFLDFSDLLTGYRLSIVLLTVQDSGIMNHICLTGTSAAAICSQMGWDPEYGQRVIDCLCRLGILRAAGTRYFPSPFAQQYLCPYGAQYQGHTLAFEHKLARNWQSLNATLKAGARVSGKRNKTKAEVQRDTALYLGAMDEAAHIRAEEVWGALQFPDTGVILDIGAGSGAYLRAFLDRHPRWSAIYCDLPEIVSASTLHSRLDGLNNRIRWCGCNLLDESPSPFDDIAAQSCDLVLLSNVIHCQGTEDTKGVLRRAAAKAKAEGVLLVHDFFSDTGWRGALYDLHMMINTLHGRTYSCQEVVDMAAACGFSHHAVRQLSSGSTLLAFATEADMVHLLLAPTPESAAGA